MSTLAISFCLLAACTLLDEQRLRFGQEQGEGGSLAMSLFESDRANRWWYTSTTYTILLHCTVHTWCTAYVQQSYCVCTALHMTLTGNT